MSTRSCLEIELQSELNLSRIVWRVAGGSNFAESGIIKIGRSRDSYYTIATEPGIVEVRVVQDVEELRAELQARVFRHLEILEQR